MKKFHKLIALCLAVCLLLPIFTLRADAADQDASKQTASEENASADAASVEKCILRDRFCGECIRGDRFCR